MSNISTDQLQVTASTYKTSHLHINVMGIVQGVGFRPFVYRLARKLGLTGSVANTGHGVNIHISWPVADIDTFSDKLKTDLPPLARISEIQFTAVQNTKTSYDFTIVPSEDSEIKSTLISPDIATCEDCVNDISSPDNHRISNGDRYSGTIVWENRQWLLDLKPLLLWLLADLKNGTSVADIALFFHLWLVRSTHKALLQLFANQYPTKNILLGGGCFQNRMLLEFLAERLEDNGFNVYTGEQVPVNDGGVSLGQACIAGWQTENPVLKLNHI